MIRFLFSTIFFAMTATVALAQGSLISVVEKIESAVSDESRIATASINEKRVNGKLVGFNKIFIVKDKNIANRFIQAALNERSKASKFEQQLNQGVVYYRVEFETVKDKTVTYDSYSIVKQDSHQWVVSVERRQERRHEPAARFHWRDDNDTSSSSTSISTSTSVSDDGSASTSIIIYNPDGSITLLTGDDMVTTASATQCN
ncbi:MAG: hypothetical protein K2L30_07635 [Duncaniella sp.]|nr:hypothetical protein [Duncaniella sp.]